VDAALETIMIGYQDGAKDTEKKRIYPRLEKWSSSFLHEQAMVVPS